MKLIIEDDEGRKTVVPFARDEISIGRKEGNTIRLTERNVSRRHARLVRQNGHVFVEDLGSYNGVKINGDKIQGRSEIREGDLIEIGDYNLAIQAEAGELAGAVATPGLDTTSPAAPAFSALETPTDGGSPGLGAAAPQAFEEDEPEDTQETYAPDLGDATTPPPKKAKAEATAVIKVDLDALNKASEAVPLAPGEQPRLVVLNTEFAGTDVTVTKSVLTIGRTEDNDLPLDHRSLSRNHCRIYRDGPGWKVLDAGSANGVRVNGEEYGHVELRGGDVLQLGHVKIRFCPPGDDFVYSAGAVSESVHTGAAPAMDDDLDFPPARGGLPVPLPWLIAGGSGLAVLTLVIVLIAGGGDDGTTEAAATAPAEASPVQPIAPPTAPVPIEAAPAADPKAEVNALVQKAGEAVERQAWDEAAALYEQVLDVDGANATAKAGLDRTRLEADAKRVYDSGVAAVASQDWATAWTKLTSVNPESRYHGAAEQKAASVRGRYADGIVEEGEAALADGDPDQAQEIAERALAIDGGNARAKRVVKDIEKAEARERALAAASRDPPARRPRTARPKPTPKPKPPPAPAAAPAVDNSEKAKAAFEKGYQLIKAKRFSEAVGALEESLKLDARMATSKKVHRLLGISYASIGNKPKAVEHYRQYLKNHPAAPDAPQLRQMLSQYEGQ